MLRRTTFLRSLLGVALGGAGARWASAQVQATSATIGTTRAETEQLFRSLTFKKKVNDVARRQFLNSLKYKDGHLAHMTYKALQPLLTDAELHQVFQMAGADMDKVGDLINSYCASTSNGRVCAYDPGQYCDPRYCSG